GTHCGWPTAGDRAVNRQQEPAYVGGQRQLGRFPALPANGNLARTPINIVQAQPNDFAGTYAESGEQQQDGMVPPANGRLRSQRSSIRSIMAAGRNLGTVESDQLLTVGTQPARSVAIAPQWRR